MENIYRTLQKRLDLYSFGFPATESGIEITLLKKLFTEHEAAVFLALSQKLETPADIAPRIGMGQEEAQSCLEEMAAKGLLFRMKTEKGARYGAIPFMHGLVEFQINNVDPEFSAIVKEYFETGFNDNISGNADLFLRVIPVNKSVEFDHHVASFCDAARILENADIIAVADCICRKQEKALGRGCDRPMETCFMFGSMARYYIDNGIGRRVSCEEAVEIVKKAQESGLVTQPSTSKNPAGMCNCCGDCCGVLGAVKKHPRPADHVFSNHQAALNASECIGCEACLERCPMEALTLDDEGIVRIALHRCIGCGLCTMQCPTNAIFLQEKPAELQREVPADTREQMMQMAGRRGLLG